MTKNGKAIVPLFVKETGIKTMITNRRPLRKTISTRSVQPSMLARPVPGIGLQSSKKVGPLGTQSYGNNVQTRRNVTMKNQKGFSLIELLIVVAIIGIIAAIAVPNLLKSRQAANEASEISSIRTITSSQATYKSPNEGKRNSTPERTTR